MHREPTWTRSHIINWGFQSAGAQLHPCIICKPPTTFYFAFGSPFLTTSIMHFPYINYLIWSTNNILQMGSLRQAHCGHKTVEHRASLEILRSEVVSPLQCPLTCFFFKVTWTKTSLPEKEITNTLIHLNPPIYSFLAWCPFPEPLSHFVPLPWFVWLCDVTLQDRATKETMHVTF